jgi:hypothetical protein
MANFVALLAARRAKASWDIRAQGLAGRLRFTLYVSSETHTWIQKAADLFGFGTDAIRWIPVDSQRRMEIAALEREVARDREKGFVPLLVVGTAGTVAFGAIDPLAKSRVSAGARRSGFTDGAHAPPRCCPGRAGPEGSVGGRLVAIDPTKWSPRRPGRCTLVRDRRHRRSSAFTRVLRLAARRKGSHELPHVGLRIPRLPR